MCYGNKFSFTTCAYLRVAGFLRKLLAQDYCADPPRAAAEVLCRPLRKSLQKPLKKSPKASAKVKSHIRRGARRPSSAWSATELRLLKKLLTGTVVVVVVWIKIRTLLYAKKYGMGKIESNLYKSLPLRLTVIADSKNHKESLQCRNVEWKLYDRGFKKV